MSQRAELLFKANRIRSVSELDIAVDRDDRPSIKLTPDSGVVTVGGGQASQTAGRIDVKDRVDQPRAALTGGPGFGRLRITDRDGDPAIDLNAGGSNPDLQAYAGRDTTVEVDTTQEGGRAAVYGLSEPAAPVIVVQARSADSTYGARGGHIVVRNASGHETGILDGRDGSLVLRGGSERTPDGATSPAYGGGELAIFGAVDEPNELHIHAKAELDSEYGVDVGNRPGILLDGPEATMELGRDSPSEAPPVGDGRFEIRDATGLTTLASRAPSVGTAEMVFSMSDGSNSETKAKVEAHDDGLMLSVATGSSGSQWDHTLLLTKQGVVVSQQSIQENASL